MYSLYVITCWYCFTASIFLEINFLIPTFDFYFLESRTIRFQFHLILTFVKALMVYTNWVITFRRTNVMK